MQETTLRFATTRLLAALAAGAVWLGAAAGEAASVSGTIPQLRELVQADPLPPLLVHLYHQLLDRRDVRGFEEQVARHYSEATLVRILHDGSDEARRAAVLALGLTGSMQSNAVLAEALEDEDELVRALAEEAMWNLWRRAGTDEQNAQLLEISRLMVEAVGDPDRLKEAIEAADALIDEAPEFAEAYNQRAIAYFTAGRYEESIADCRRVLELNPHHFGAAGGMAQCLLLLGRPREALDAFRLAIEINPNMQGVQAQIEELERELGDAAH